MRYISTRGGVAPLSFAEAVMMGLANDGGLLLPESVPTIDAVTLRHWATLTFPDLAIAVMQLYVGTDLSRAALADLVHRSYATFNHPEVTPLIYAGQRPILELFHGPTAAFKDVALQFLGNLFEYLLEQSGDYLNILGATSGDTGSAAIYGVRGKARMQIFILYPHGRVSPMQERQMTTVADSNVHALALRGTFDDAQAIVKTLFNDTAFKRYYHLGAVNSINWARVLAQVVYYFYAWGKVSAGNSERRVSFAVPTGNFGDIFAGFIARRMGLPIERLILATNRNDILTRFVHTGSYQVGDVWPTLTPSMDIQVASNFERYLYFLLDQNHAAVAEYMQQFARSGCLHVTAACRAQVATDFTAIAVNEAETLAQMQATFADSGYILDPHTAVGVRAAQAFPDAICLATAHPAKFDATIQQALNCAAPASAALQGLLEKPSRYTLLDADSAAVREYLITMLG